MAKWSVADIPRQRGKLAAVTGANSGLGFHVALELARAGATVVLACRSKDKAADAVQRIRAEFSKARISAEALDLADLKSVRRFARNIVQHGKLDLLVNNAGIMGLPQRETTADGFEMQFGVNHLGHFALTAWLMPVLLEAETPRVVTVSSLAHTWATLDFSNLQGERFYSPWVAYAQSKLANLLFARELQVRADAAGWPLVSVAAHPGLSATNLIAGPASRGISLASAMLAVGSSLFTQSAARGALPTLYAATAEVERGGFYGPDGFAEFWGGPQPARLAPHARDRETARELWRVSEELTGATYRRSSAATVVGSGAP